MKRANGRTLRVNLQMATSSRFLTNNGLSPQEVSISPHQMPPCVGLYPVNGSICPH